MKHGASWDEIARGRRRRENWAWVGLSAMAGLFAVAAVFVGDDPRDVWLRWAIAGLAAFLFAFSVGVAVQRFWLIPRELRATLTETPDELSMVPQQPGRAAFGSGPAALVWIATALVSTFAPSGAFPLVLLIVLWGRRCVLLVVDAG